MVIEAAPRLRDENLGAFSLCPTKQLETTNLSYSASEGKSGHRLVGTTFHHEKKNFPLWERTDTGLSRCRREVHGRIRKTFGRRRHPYVKEGKEKRSADSLNLILSAFSNHKCPACVRPHHCDKSIEFVRNFSSRQKLKRDEKESKLPLNSIPIFTANANENNDNCPDTNYNPREITKRRTPAPISEEDCDIEIQDLTEETHQYTNVWRQRRRSFNTNPLSAPALRPEQSPFLLCLNELFSKDNLRENGNTPRVFCNSTETQSCISPEVKSQSEQDRLYENSSDTSTPSIERLVEFFESTSNSVLPRVNVRKSSKLPRQPNLHSREKNQQIICERESIFQGHSPSQRSKPFAHDGQKRPSSIRSEHHRQNHGFLPDFSPFSPKVFDPAIGISGRNLPRTIISNGGGVYNNNANAASTPPESHLLWSGNKYLRDQQFSRYESSPDNTSSPPSPVLFSRECKPFSPAVGRFSPDIGSDNLTFPRVLTWSGSKSNISPVDRRKGESPLRLDDLIDLQTTSTRSSSWRGENSPSHSLENSNKSHFKFSIIQSPEKKEKGGDCFRKSLCQVQRERSESVSLSANNHHNAPWFSSENSRLRADRLYEEHFPFEHLRLHRSLLDPFLEKRFSFLNSDRGEMGCIQSIAKAKVSPDRCHHSVIVEDIQAAIDRTPTEIEEKSPIVLRYRTPYFRASAHVIVPPIPRKETWTVGWIQACDSMKFINQYGNLGSSSWEIPALKDRRITAVSDSDGVSYPWYGNTTEIATVEGPTETSRSLTLRMNDNFYPSVTWDIPVSEGSEAHLTHIVRDQSFTTWLAAVNQTTGRLEVLRTVKWHFYLEIDVDPTQELGKRARIMSPLVQKQPIILKNNSEPIYVSSPQRGSNSESVSRQKRITTRRPGAGGDNNSNNHTNFIPKSALVRPSANNAQTLIWRPNRDVPVIVVPAKEEYKENNEVVWFTRAPAVHGHDQNVRILSLQEMSQLKKTIS